MISALWNAVVALFALWFIPLCVWIVWLGTTAYIPEHAWMAYAAGGCTFFMLIYFFFNK